jgi:hypothetical protein
MALEQKELMTETTGDQFSVYKKVSMHERITAVFGTSAGAETLATCSPVGYNSSTGWYGAWVAPDAASIVIDLTGATAGSWSMTVDGVATGSLAWNVTAESVRTTLLGMGYVASVELAASVYTIVFDANAQIIEVPVLTGNVGAITGGTPTATVTAGSSSFGLDRIVGFVWPEEITLSATEQVNGVIMTQGRIAYSEIAATVDPGDVTDLDAALKSETLSRGIIVEDLVNIH